MEPQPLIEYNDKVNKSSKKYGILDSESDDYKYHQLINFFHFSTLGKLNKIHDSMLIFLHQKTKNLNDTGRLNGLWLIECHKFLHFQQ